MATLAGSSSRRFSKKSTDQEKWMRQVSVGSVGARSIAESSEHDSLVGIQPEVPSPTKAQTIWIYLICSSAILVANIAVGAFPILIPIEVLRKDYRLAWIGTLFLVYGLVVFTFELFQFKIVPVIGVKKTFVITTGLLGLCDISFGLLDFTDNQIVFGVMGCLIRSVEGFCYAGVMNSVMTMLCLAIPDKAIITIGLIDALVGLGFALGPLIAGVLYSAVDFTLPYALFGITLILISIWGQLGLRPVAGYLGRSDFGFLRILYTDLAFVASAVIVFSMGIVVGFLEATLEVYLSQFNEGTIIEGTIFFAAWTAAAISSPIWGWILRKTGQDLLFLLLGPVIESLVFVFFGPFPGLGAIAMMLGVSVFCLLIITITTSMSLMAAIDIMLRQSERYGLSNDVVTYAFISAIWLSMLYLGEGIGGIVSGTVLDISTYPSVAVALVVIQLSLGAVAAVIMYFSWRRSDVVGTNGIAVNMNRVSSDGSSMEKIRSSYEVLP